MGQGQSKGKLPEQQALVVSEETTKIEFFSNIFTRLLKTSDILDIVELTKGPDDCGAYVMLLAKNIEKDFKKIRLQTGLTNTSAMNDFLYSPAKSVIKSSPSDKVACRYLAIFYIRVLQLVAALTMSIHSFPDLVNRIRNRVYETSLKLQRRGIKAVFSKNEQSQRRQKRENWLLGLLIETDKTNVYTLGDKTQFQYNRVTNILTYTSNDLKEYKVRLEVKDPDTYSISDSLLTDSTYWIEITNVYTTEQPRFIIYRALVNKDGGGWLFQNVPDSNEVEEEPFTGYENDWAYELESYILSNNKIQGTNVKKQNSYGYNGDYGARRSRSTRNSKAKNTSVSNTRRNNVKKVNVSDKLSLSNETTLPPKFVYSHKSMVKWFLEVPNWSESAPAPYRATLLFNKPSLPTTPGSTYVCADNWANKRLRDIPPFASLEALFYDGDDGSASANNVSQLKQLSNAFNMIYKDAPVGNTIGERPKDISGFEDVFMPPIGEFLEKNICVKRNAQGEAILEERYSIIFEKAQAELVKKYKEHLDECYNLLKTIFTTKKVGIEETIQFSDSFINAKNGARNELEENIIPNSITIIANHYLDIEKIYYDALKKAASGNFK